MKNVDQNTFLDIDLKSLGDNYSKIKKKVHRNCIVAATVKSNAYGLGVKKVLPTLIKSKCKHFFVASTDEAIETIIATMSAPSNSLIGTDSDSNPVANTATLQISDNELPEVTFSLADTAINEVAEGGVPSSTTLTASIVNAKLNAVDLSLDFTSSGAGVSAAFSLTAWTCAVVVPCEDEFKQQVVEVFGCFFSGKLRLEMELTKVDYFENILLLCFDEWHSFLQNLLLLQLDICPDIVFRQMNRD